MSDKPATLLEELKRRHVWRMAIAYAVVAWLLVQVATQVFPFFSIPDWVVRLVVILIVIGFPVAVVSAWVYELTPKGIRRTTAADSPEARPEHASRQIGRKLNMVIVTVLVLALALMAWRLLLPPRAPAAATAAAAAARGADTAQRDRGISAADTSMAADTDASRTASSAAVPATSATLPARSVAVLPFTNESGKPGEQFFSDGLSEDLITALSQFAGLKVISRNSAFQFRHSSESSGSIGKKLGVAHLLEGSVQHAGDKVRITATLVNAADGSILWSQRYDKPYKDLFALQDAITQAVAEVLKARLLTVPGAVVQSDRPPSGNLDAYVAYQHGAAYAALGTETSLHQAIDAFGKAVDLDPRYAAAYAQMSRTWSGLRGQYLGGTAARQANARARDAVNTALELDPDSSLAHQARSVLLSGTEMDWRGAEAEAQRALQLAPNDARAKFTLGGIVAILGQTKRALELTRQALESDPRHANWYSWSSTYLTGLGRLDEARQATDTAIALQPGAAALHEQLVIIEILRGDAGAALAAARQEPPGPWHEIAMTLALQIGPDRRAADAALQKLIAGYAELGPYQIAEVYALRRDPDNAFKWLDRAFASRDAGVTDLLYDPLILRYRDDPRFAAYCGKVGLPTLTDAVATGWEPSHPHSGG